MKPTSLPSRNGNIDAIRLIAALQVLVVHFLEHVAPPVPPVQAAIDVLSVFPGVPVFFVLSGYLVIASAARSRSVGSYGVKRFLRLYPGLWVCVAASICLVMAVGYKLSATPGAVAVWLLAQLTVGQSYNPAFLRGFGVGALNGSLWTIGVEVQFYVLAPLLLTLLTKLRIAKQWAIAALVVGLALVNEMFGYLKATSSPGFAVKVTGITVLPFLVYFVLGATVYVTGAEKRFGTRRVFWSALACHLVIAYVAWRAGMRFGGNYLHVISGMTLAAVALSFAFLPERTWSRILEGRDYSYSLYLYHMPIINALLFLGLSGASAAVACAVAVSIASVLSWHLVEKPAIRAGRAGNWTDRILPAPSVQGS